MLFRFTSRFVSPSILRSYSTMPVTQSIKIGSKQVTVPTGLYINGEWVRLSPPSFLDQDLTNFLSSHTGRILG